MGLFQENQKAKIIFEADDKVVEMDCYIEKIYYDRLKLKLPKAANRYTPYLKTGNKLTLNVFSHAGVIVQDSIILNSPLEKDFIIEYDMDAVKIENRRRKKRYSANCDLIIFRPLLGNIETQLIDLSTSGLRYYSDIPLEAGSEFDCKLILKPTDAKILFKGRILDNKGLPAGVYRMFINKIAYKDKQRLLDYCETVLANYGI